MPTNNSDNEEDIFSDDEQVIEIEDGIVEEIDAPVEQEQLLEKKYKILLLSELPDEQLHDVKKIQNILQLSSQRDVVQILKHYKWDLHKVLQEYAEFDANHVFKQAGITQVSFANKKNFECPACFDDAEDCIELTACGHVFCLPCWQSYIMVKIDDGKLSMSNLTCMGSKCTTKLDESIVRQVMGETDSQFLEQYVASQFESYISQNKLIKYCPSKPHCGYVAKLTGEYEPLIAVECECAEEFCFDCLHKPHAPATCLMAEKWKILVKNEASSMSWVRVNTKPCPKCKVPIEKNQGCNMMRCASCQAHFCWICGSSGGYGHTCSFKYLEWDDSAVDSKMEQKMYTYLTRFQSHFMSFTHMMKYKEYIYMSVMNQIKQEKEEYEYTESDYDWIKSAYKTQLGIRRLIINCIIYAYYEFEVAEREMSKTVESSKSKVLQAKRNTKLKQAETQNLSEQSTNLQNMQLYKHLYLNHLLQLETAAERLNALLDEDAIAILQTKNDILNMVDIVNKAREGILDVLSKRDTSEYNVNK